MMNNLTIPAYSEQAAQAVKERLDSLAKVPGSLGKLEELAIRLAGITGRTCPSFPQKSVVLFAADHDITLKGVSATGQEVTEIQVRNFLKGGGTINAFCRNAGASLTVVDVGIKGDVGGAEGLVRRKVVHAARDFSEGPAMTREEALACVQVGIDMAHEEAKKGVTLLSAGEMGIGNTSPSSAEHQLKGSRASAPASHPNVSGIRPNSSGRALNATAPIPQTRWTYWPKSAGLSSARWRA